MKNQELRSVLASIRPTTDIMTYLRNGGRSVEKVMDLFEARYGKVSFDEANYVETCSWRIGWKDLPSDEIVRQAEEAWANYEGQFAPSVDINSEELVTVISGQTRTRAEYFLSFGGGYKWLELPLVGKNLFNAWNGLQFHALGRGQAEDRDCIRRSIYYAADRNGLIADIDEPAVIVARIPKRNLYRAVNPYEFAVSREDYKKLINPEILGIDEMKERFGI